MKMIYIVIRPDYDWFCILHWLLVKNDAIQAWLLFLVSHFWNLNQVFILLVWIGMCSSWCFYVSGAFLHQLDGKWSWINDEFDWKWARQAIIVFELRKIAHHFNNISWIWFVVETISKLKILLSCTEYSLYLNEGYKEYQVIRTNKHE